MCSLCLSTWLSPFSLIARRCKRTEVVANRLSGPAHHYRHPGFPARPHLRCFKARALGFGPVLTLPKSQKGVHRCSSFCSFVLCSFLLLRLHSLKRRERQGDGVGALRPCTTWHVGIDFEKGGGTESFARIREEICKNPLSRKVQAEPPLSALDCTLLGPSATLRSCCRRVLCARRTKPRRPLHCLGRPDSLILVPAGDPVKAKKAQPGAVAARGRWRERRREKKRERGRTNALQMCEDMSCTESAAPLRSLARCSCSALRTLEEGVFREFRGFIEGFAIMVPSVFRRPGPMPAMTAEGSAELRGVLEEIQTD